MSPGMLRSVRAVLSHLIDYAGLFPPAGLDMASAVANFANYRDGPDHWALGRFVVPAARLEEFEAARSVLPQSGAGYLGWPLAVLLGDDVTADAGRATAYGRHAAAAGVVVQSMELRVTTPQEVRRARELVPEPCELYCECRPGPGLPALLDAIVAAGARAKLRTGGIRAEDFPSAEAVAGFVTRCAAARVPFKATAGLHHPVRGSYPLTYEAGSPLGTMFGYLNLVLAATLAWQGSEAAVVSQALLADDRRTVAATDAGLALDGVACPTPAIARARGEFLMAVGSCSFTEPLSEIRGS